MSQFVIRTNDAPPRFLGANGWVTRPKSALHFSCETDGNSWLAHLRNQRSPMVRDRVLTVAAAPPEPDFGIGAGIETMPDFEPEVAA